MSINLTDEIDVKTKKGKLGAAKQIFLDGDQENLQQIGDKTHQLEDAVKDITATGGASTANAVSYSNSTSGMTAVTAQGAIDELAVKNASQDAEISKKANAADVTYQMQTGQTRVNAELVKKFDKESVAQETGNAEDKVMSQKAVSNKLSDLSIIASINNAPFQATINRYIDVNGIIQQGSASNKNYCTDYIPVSQGEKYTYHGKYAKGIFKAVWGYSDNQGSNPIALVDFTGEEQTTVFTIDNEQVKYIIAWGNTDTEVWVAKEGISKQVENNAEDILHLKTNVKYGLTVIVDANGKGDYTSLQEALYKVNDTAATHVTILVMPGIYVMDEYDSTKRHFANNRNLSIIGLDRNTCIVRNDNGNYTTNPYVDNAPFKLSGKVLISNLTIISSDEQNNAGNGIAYCVHVDSEANEGDIMEIRDCILYNNHGACIGIGLRQGFTLKIVGCEVKSDLKSDDLTQTWQGAIICHDQLKPNVTNENLFIKDSIIESNSEVCIVLNSTTYKNSIDLIAIGNIIVSTNSARALTVNSPNTKNIRSANNNIVQK